MPEVKKYKISQAAQIVDLETYVLRFWETEFKQLRPHRTSTGQRSYLQTHIDLLLKIKKLLYEDKLTIEGARQKLEEPEPDPAVQDDYRQLLEYIERELMELRSKLIDY